MARNIQRPEHLQLSSGSKSAATISTDVEKVQIDELQATPIAMEAAQARTVTRTLCNGFIKEAGRFLAEKPRRKIGRVS